MKAPIIVVGICLAFAAFAGNANELLITPSVSKARVASTSTVYAIDFVSTGEAVAFQFNIKLPKGIKDSNVNLRSCVVDLPKAFGGECRIAKGHIVGIVYSDKNETFAAGIIPVGKISLDGGLAKSQRQLNVTEFFVSDSKARPIESSVTVIE